MISQTVSDRNFLSSKEVKMESITKCLATNIKNLRQMKKMTQMELAEKAGVSLIFIQGIESERKWISPTTIKSLADAFGVPESKLFESCFEKERSPSGLDRQRYSHIPEDIWLALSTTCRHPQWKWETFRWIIEGYKKTITKSPR